MLFEFWVWINSKRKTEFQILKLDLIWKWALAHWPGPTYPAGSNPIGQNLGRSNRPRPASSSHSSPLDSLQRTLNRCRHCLAIPADSGELRHRHLGQNAPLSTLSRLHRTDLLAVSSPRRPKAWLHSGFRLPVATEPKTSPATSYRLQLLWGEYGVVVLLCYGWWLCRRESKQPRWGCSSCHRCRSGEDFPRQPLAGHAGTTLPFHPNEHLGDGECDFLLPTLLLLRPRSLAIRSRSVS
jgi:hypothetical protein